MTPTLLEGPVHPHVRGEGVSPLALSAATWGSPPRAWGRGLQRASQPLHRRFTPTCVGKGSPGSASWASASVHPHVRGEGTVPAHGKAVTLGSPPRAWGRGARRRPRRSGPGFTPTCVGKGAPATAPAPATAVHPHVRGEGASSDNVAAPSQGSPPRAWGRGDLDSRQHPAGRFTPTCVGKGPRRETLPAGREVHPHVRGEGVTGSIPAPPSGGSPPRAWGRGLHGSRSGLPCRFTPTCVGKGCHRSRATADPGVHPHVRGEGVSGVVFVPYRQGSPPRAWGRVPRGGAERRRCRFTPTCVGKGPSPRPRSSCLPVHPHVRGEGAAADVNIGEDEGSPPRAWGRARTRPPHRFGRGFTPTCVGKGFPSGSVFM